ncbi:MAG: hypothetical protein AB7S68_32160 [Polyangiaceae bacterium]
MRSPLLVGLLAFLPGCGSPPAEAPDPDFYLAPSASSEPEVRPSRVCARLQQKRSHAFCSLEVDEAALERMGGYELSYQDKRLVKACPSGWRSQQIFPDDQGCFVYDYSDGELVRVREVTPGGRTLFEGRFSEAGSRVEYFDGSTRKARTEDVFGARFELDAQRRITRETLLDHEGNPTPDALGRYSLRHTYDDRGEELEMQVLDVHGTPTVDDRGVGVERYKRFSSGALQEQALFDAEGKPVDADRRYQREVWSRDEDGRPLERKLFRADRKPARYEEGYHRVRTTHRKRRAEELLLDPSGTPYREFAGGSRFVTWRDERNRPRRMEVFHLGRLVEKPGAFSILEVHYGEHEVERRFYGKDRKLVQGRAAFSVFSYTDDDFLRRVRYLDAKREPILWVDTAVREYAYADGKLTEERAYGVDGQLIEKGIPATKYAYDELGRIKQRQGFDREGNELPVLAARRISFKFKAERNDELASAKAAAMERARKVWRRITQEHMSFTRAFRTYDELRKAETEPKLRVEILDPERLASQLEIGSVSQPVEWDGAIRIYQRVP